MPEPPGAGPPERPVRTPGWVGERLPGDGGRAPMTDGGRAAVADVSGSFDLAPVPILVLDTAGAIRYANPAAHEFLQPGLEEPLRDAQFLAFVAENWTAAVGDAIDRVATDGEPAELERVELRDARGTTRFAYLAGTPIDRDAGDCALFVCKDETELVEARRDLAEREAKFRSIADSSHDLIFRIDEEGWLTYLSPAAERLLGYEPEDLVGQHLESVLTEDSIEDAYDAYDRIRAGEPVEDLQLRVERKDGTERELSVNGRPIELAGEVQGTQGVARDVTERRERERRLERQNERLERFASVVSHDLRNPMSAAHGALGLIRQDYDGKGVDILQQALDRMEELLDDLLTLARQGQAVESTSSLGLVRVAEEAWTTAETHGGQLVFDDDGIVHADESRFRQLLENLFRNAIEHGGEDVTVFVGRTEDGFYVGDDGVGIPADQRDRVFEEGYSTASEGTGFGLSIVREVARAHGWDVQVRESEDGGARFEFHGVDVEETGA